MTATTHEHHHACGGVFGPSAAGLALGVATLPLHYLLGHSQSVQLAALLVGVIGAIYVGFAIQGGSLRQTVVEIAVATMFLGAALGALWISPWCAPAAVALHGVWDWIHHLMPGSRDLVAPRPWYPPMCAAYDWIYGLGLTLIWVS